MLLSTERRASSRVVATIICLLFCLDAQARPKTDTLVLANGDQVTGEIKSMENGLLRYSTQSMGTVSVEWDDVRELDSNYLFRVRTVGGKRYFGAIGRSPLEGHMQVVHAEGIEDYPIMDVVAMRPIDSKLEDRLDTVISAGYSDFKASDSSTATMGLTMSYADELSENVLDARSVVTDNADETNTSNRVDLSRQRLWDNPRYFNRYGASWESNDELAIDSRLGLSYGIGRHFIDSNRTKLAVTAGLQGLTEEDSLGETTDSLEGMLILQFNTWRFDSPELSLESSLRVYPGITESGRYRADGDLTLSWEIIEDFNLNITAFGNFDSESNEEGDDYDYGITTGVEWQL